MTKKNEYQIEREKQQAVNKKAMASLTSEQIGLAPDTDYAQSVLGNMASSLQGKLLLIHGLMDPYYHASGFLQLVDALVKENKDFDLVVLPSGGHTPDSSHYGIRKIWDYLVIHLQGNKPPLEFRLSSGLEFALSKG